MERKYLNRIIIALIPFGIVVGYFCNHSSNLTIYKKAKEDIAGAELPLSQLLTYCDTLTDDKFNTITLTYRKGWDRLNGMLDNNRGKVSTKDASQATPSFVMSLLFNSNGLSATYKKNDYLAIVYPYANYALKRCVLYYPFNRSEFLKAKFPEGLNRANVPEKNDNKSAVYIVDSSWFLIIKDVPK